MDDQDRVALSLNESPTPGFTTYDLCAYWQPRKNFRITTGFENLLDKSYLDHLSVRPPNKTDLPVDYFPTVLEPGFNFYFTAQLDY